MDNIEKYRQLVKDLLAEIATLENSSPSTSTETQIVFDDTRDHYMLFRVGWWHEKRVRVAALYVRLAEGKIWIEEDRTEDGLATELLAAGVPKEDIVLAFHHPEIRPFTDFAVA